MSATRPGILSILLLFGSFSVAQSRAQEALDCSNQVELRQLDFWIGSWIVQDRATGERVGTNRIEHILGGCALMEFWTSGRGGEGRSLFYYVPATETWKQVWVTDRPFRPGGVKEKTLVELADDGSVRFQGEIVLADGSTYLDRTTLSPRPDGRVRQVIERSTDGGQTWTTGFDAIYVPANDAPVR